MSIRPSLGTVGLLVAALVFATSEARAQCTKDTDCKGERVCEAGACVDPPPAAAPSAPAAAPSAPAAAPPAAGAQPPSPIPGPGVAVEPRVVEPLPETTTEVLPRKGKRHSTGMMAGGIVMVSLVPVALLVAMVGSLEKDGCESGGYVGFDSTTGVYRESQANCDRFNASIYGGLFAGAALLGGGLPMIIIGGRRDPVGTARVAPWASPHGAGLGLRLEL